MAGGAVAGGAKRFARGDEMTRGDRERPHVRRTLLEARPRAVRVGARVEVLRPRAHLKVKGAMRVKGAPHSRILPQGRRARWPRRGLGRGRWRSQSMRHPMRPVRARSTNRGTRRPPLARRPARRMSSARSCASCPDSGRNQIVSRIGRSGSVELIGAHWSSLGLIRGSLGGPCELNRANSADPIRASLAEKCAPKEGKSKPSS